MPRVYPITISLALLLSMFIYLAPRDNSPVLVCEKKESHVERLRCLIPYFEDLTNKVSAASAVESAKNLQKEGVVNDCHLAAHVIGAENLHKNDLDAGKAFASCPTDCWAGCHHGVMEEYLALEKNTGTDLGRFVHTCDSISEDPISNRQCLHGVGHGILRHNDMPLENAINLCLNFPDGFSANTCLGGVFMQNVQNISLDEEKIFVSKLPALCEPTASFNDRVIENKCLAAIGEGIMFYTGHNLERSKNICLELKESDREQCVKAAEFELWANEREIAD